MRVHPLWVRVGFVVLTPAGGIGVLLYVALWLVVPRDDEPDSVLGRFGGLFGDSPSWLGIGLVLLGLVLLAGQFGLGGVNLLLAAVLVGLGIALFRSEERRAARRRQTHPRDPAGANGPDAQAETYSRPVPQPPWAAAERSGLGWMTVGTAMLVLAVLAVLAGAGIISPPLVWFPALGLLVLGVGLLVGAFVGRARWLILPGVALVPILLVASLVRVPLAGGVGDVYEVPRTASDLAPAYHRMIGSMYFELTRLDAGEVGRLDAVVTTGEIRVAVPAGTRVIAHAEVGIGSVLVGSQGSGGVGSDLRRTVQLGRGDGPVLHLDARVGIGEISVFHLRPAPGPPPRRARGEGRSQGEDR